MKTKVHNSIGVNLNDFQSITNSNKSSIDILKHLSLSAIICLIIFPIVFIVIGIIYRNSCVAKPDLPLFLVIFGILILINLFIYTILGVTFLALIRRARSFSLEKGVGILLATILGVIFGVIIFIWWIIGTIWWIKLTLSIEPQLKHPTSLAFCHPVVYWTALVANILGLIGFIVEICIAIGCGITASKQSSKDRG